MAECSDKNKNENDLEASGPTFDPPLYRQRYSKVRDILQEEAISNVADFGCSEGKFLWYLKNSPNIKDVAAIDVHEGVLYSTSKIASPLPWDYIHKRETPLRIRLFHGSVAEFDYRIKMYEAITGIELLEHLESSVLKKLPEVVFGILRARLIIFTTPNSEFNVLFPSCTGFRHWDHKFEWTRGQFQEWCESVIKEYPSYTVSYSGVGDPPPDSEDVGHCSQMAIFRNQKWNTDCSTQQQQQDKLPYKLIEEFKHPSKDDT